MPRGCFWRTGRKRWAGPANGAWTISRASTCVSTYVATVSRLDACLPTLKARPLASFPAGSGPG
jgi:hypothetical protein